MDLETEFETLPSYTDAVDSALNAVVQPTILVIAGQSIHAVADPSVPLYQANRGLARIGHTSTVVMFERIERTVRNTASGIPRVKQRVRHIYNLRHEVTPGFYITAVSSHTLGHIGLRLPLLNPSRIEAVRLDIPRNGQGGHVTFSKNARPLFEIQHQNGAYKWKDNDGNDIAMEYEADSQHRLLITIPLQRETLDALVALWCCLIWQNSVSETWKEQERLKREIRRAAIVRTPVIPRIVKYFKGDL